MKSCELEVGGKFGDLTIVELTKIGRVGWRCMAKCKCGKTITIPAGRISSGHQKSCGCRRTIHGMVYTPEYKIWSGVLERCLNRNSTGFHSYGGRGITVCERWIASFEMFLSDVGKRPSPDHSLDRINNDGNYEPDNVRWATAKEQGRNRRFNRIITAFGKTLCIAEWSELNGIPHNTICSRLEDGWPNEEAVTTPARRKKSAPKKEARRYHFLFPQPLNRKEFSWTPPPY